MKLSILAGSTSQTVNVFVRDSSSTTGAGLTGLVYNSSSLTAYYALPKAAAVSITLATLAAVTTAWTSGGFKEIDSANMPGWYRLDLPDAALASGRFVSVHLKGVTNMAPLPVEIELTAWNNQDAVHGGLSCLPNTACTTNASLLTSGTGTDQLSVASGRIDVGKLLGTAWLTPGVAGTPDVNVKQFDGQTVSAAGTVTMPGTVASATNITAGTITTVTNLTNAATSGDLTAAMKTSVTTAASSSTPVVTLAAGAIQAIWDALTSALTTSGSIGKWLLDKLDVVVSTRLATSGYTAPPSAAAVSAAVVDQTLSGHTTSGTVGGALNSASSAGDPWNTAVPGAYGAGTAGYVLATAGTEATAIKLKTDTIPASPAAVGSAMTLTSAYDAAKTPAQVANIPTAAQVADKILGRSLAGGADGGRTVQDALRVNRNKVILVGTTMTVYEEDDATEAWTATIATDADADPITSVSPE